MRPFKFLAIAVVLGVSAVLSGCTSDTTVDRAEVERVYQIADAYAADLEARIDALATATPSPEDAAELARLQAEVARIRAEAERIVQTMLASIRDDGSVDVSGAVTPFLPLLPPPWGVAALGASVLLNGFLEWQRRRNRRQAVEIVESIDAARRASPAMREAMGTTAAKDAMHGVVSADTFELIKAVSST